MHWVKKWNLKPTNESRVFLKSWPARLFFALARQNIFWFWQVKRSFQNNIFFEFCFGFAKAKNNCTGQLKSILWLPLSTDVSCQGHAMWPASLYVGLPKRVPACEPTTTSPHHLCQLVVVSKHAFTPPPFTCAQIGPFSQCTRAHFHSHVWYLLKRDKVHVFSKNTYY